MLKQILQRESFTSNDLTVSENRHTQTQTAGDFEQGRALDEPAATDSLPEEFSVPQDKNISASDLATAGEPSGFKKYWPRVERFVVEKMLELADDKLQKPDELSLYFVRIYDLLPIAVRLVVSQERFVAILMSKREPLVEKVKYYKAVREQQLA